MGCKKPMDIDKAIWLRLKGLTWKKIAQELNKDGNNVNKILVMRRVLEKFNIDKINPKDFVRNNSPWVWDGVHFESENEMLMAKELLTTPIEGVNYQLRIGNKLFDFFPQEYDKFVSALGATAVDYLTKIDCCGVALNLVGDKKGNNKCIANKLLDIKNNTGAQILSTGCPFCFTQFDMGQITAAREYPELKDSKIPVLYAVELLGLAMGKSLDDIGYKTHKIKPKINVLEVI